MSQQQFLHRSPSQETEDRRHLLSPSVPGSVAPSVLESTRNDPCQQATSIASEPYKGFSSRAAYLAALQEWAESKKYLETGTQLKGWYGNDTMEEIVANAPERPRLGLRRKFGGWRDRGRK
ncbi:hypothetical protein K431DRAFT_287550 [Polychaeton citri CBS 116435]|uniref:Uncharacterized protein n=1 Tax=Polychaeton citri CBS 116435 TaxID=1314669 RepID=A0A9P4Q2E7_9PEZI|nr:hypothetical protein K431DRAFT_287550 [Polychaeton citri CBS 116435]